VTTGSLFERVRELEPLLPGAVYLWHRDADGRSSIPYAGSGVLEAFGVERRSATLDARRILERVHPDDLDGLVASIEASGETLRPWLYEFRIRRPDGTVRWLAARSLPERLADGATQWTGFVRDVTEDRLLSDRFRKSEALLRQVTDALHDVVCLVDGEGRIEFCTPSSYLALGREATALEGQRLRELFDERDWEEAEGLLNGTDADPIELRGAHAEGREVWFEATSRRVAGHAGVVVSCRDRTARVMDRRRLLHEIGYRRTLVELMAEMLAAELDDRFYQRLVERAVELVPGAQAGSMLLWNAGSVAYRYVAATGLDLDALRQIRMTPEILGRSQPPRIERVAPFDRDAELEPDVLRAIESAGRFSEIVMSLSVPIRAGGEVRGFLNLDTFEDPSAFDDAAIEVAGALATQVAVALQRLELQASLREQQERFQHQAVHDPLTNLPNRRLFLDRLEQAMRRARRRESRVGVIFLDLDGFKQVNDLYGHATGDAVLIETARRVQDALRAEDTAARLGGDEFAIVLNEVHDRSDLDLVGARLRASLAKPFGSFKGQKLEIAASIGYALHPEDGEELETVLNVADNAMYREKNAR